jgi:MoaA/NifB/PqqE/SkfB family radical SAM enzyme
MSERLPILDGGLRQQTAPAAEPERGRLRWVSGVYKTELDGIDPFRWMGQSAALELEPSDLPRFLELEVMSEFFDLSQRLEITLGDQRHVFPLVHGWGPLSCPVQPGAQRADIEINVGFPLELHPEDPRQLAVRVRRPLLHRNAARHHAILTRHENESLNLREMIEGRSILRSTPPSLGIDIHGECNVKPPCVYCEWDAMKTLEGDNAGRPFDAGTLIGYGEFFSNAAQLVNCSIGEPFMLRQLDAVLEACGECGKALEMSTNGQILTARNIDRLLGRDIRLYISLDAATPETYAKLRNDKLPTILANIRRLVSEKGGRGGLPHVYLVFMPMRVNHHELGLFVQLCAELDVDQLVLRPLNPSEGVDLTWERAGNRFIYHKEILPLADLIRLSGRADELCRRYGVPLSNQLDFGRAARDMFEELFEQGRLEVTAAPDTPPHPRNAARPPLGEDDPEPTPPPLCDQPSETGACRPSLGAERWPVCTEPWRNLYILRRGVMPCCYGGQPLAGMDSYREAWNGATLQAIRTELARGRFHAYCLRTPSCPIVRKSEGASELSVLQTTKRAVYRAWRRLNRMTGGIPRRVVRRLRPARPEGEQVRK